MNCEVVDCRAANLREAVFYFSTILALFINFSGVDSKYLVNSILSPGFVRTH